MIAGFEDREDHTHEKECVCPLEAGASALVARKKMRTSVLETQELSSASDANEP